RAGQGLAREAAADDDLVLFGLGLRLGLPGLLLRGHTQDDSGRGRDDLDDHGTTSPSAWLAGQLIIRRGEAKWPREGGRRPLSAGCAQLHEVEDAAEDAPRHCYAEEARQRQNRCQDQKGRHWYAAPVKPDDSLLREHISVRPQPGYRSDRVRLQ